MMWLSDETLLDLRIDPMQPPFSMGASLLIKLNLRLQLCNSTFGRAKLIRKLLGHLESLLDVRFGYTGGLVKQLQNSFVRHGNFAFRGWWLSCYFGYLGLLPAFLSAPSAALSASMNRLAILFTGPRRIKYGTSASSVAVKSSSSG